MQALGRIFKCQTGEIAEKQSTVSQSDLFFVHQAETVMDSVYSVTVRPMGLPVYADCSMKAPPDSLHLF